MEAKYPLEVPAIRILQPLGEFYITSLSARVLLDLTFSEPLRVVEDEEEEMRVSLRGTQRPEKPRRLREIARFIETTEAAFPNSIILAANYNQLGELEEDVERRWTIESNGEYPAVRLKIPTLAKLASIVDGQHRLHGFQEASAEKLDMQVPCSIYFDLPNPYQAYLFATINFNQKRVDRSLAYQLFGINVDDEPPESWSPDKAAVFMSRKLNTEPDSSLYHRIIVAAENDEVLRKNRPQGINWAVSTATIVDGILRLFSSNPKRDRDAMNRLAIDRGRTRKVLADDKTPFRALFLACNDALVYTAIKNFFLAIDEVFWKVADENSYIYRTVGLQALFDVLRTLANPALSAKDVSKQFFIQHLPAAQAINFSDAFFVQASGKGRTRMRNAILIKIGRLQIDEIDASPEDLAEYQRVTR
jgi:DNA phosphorothioation-associated DGQHR protein 1